MVVKKIGIIITTDAQNKLGESGKGRYFIERFSKVDDTFEYEVIPGVTGALPKLSELSNYFGFIISGSGYSVNDPYQWIMNLQNFIIQLDQYNKENKNKPVRLFGICYGHQLIAKTFGGVVQPIKDNKFIYGAEKITFNSDVSSKSWFQKALNGEREMMICQVHGEEVSQVPSNAIVLASSESCETEAFVYEGDDIFSTQGHPEFEIDIMENLVGFKLMEKELITREQFEKGNEQVKTVPYDQVTAFVLEFLKH